MRFAIIKHWMQNRADFLAEIKGVLDTNRPGMSISVNGGPFVECWDVLKQCSWSYSEAGERSHNSVVLRGLGLDSPQCGIHAGKDVYDVWPTSLVKVMTSSVLAQGCRTFFFFTQGRLGDGTFEESKYALIRSINEETAAKQGFVKNAEPLTAAAVYHSEASWIEAGTRDRSGRNDYPDDSHACAVGAVINTFRAISVPCEFLPSWRCNSEELGRFQLIVIPEQKCLGDDERGAFIHYVERGGNLLVTGDTGLRDNSNQTRNNFALADLLGVDYAGICTDYQAQAVSGYMRFQDHPYFSRLRRIDYYMPGNFIKIRVRDAEVLAHIAEPVGIQNPDFYIGWGPLPPGPKAEWPCLTATRRGKGLAIYCVAPLGKYAATGVAWPVELIKGICQTLGVSAGVKLEGPEGTAEATFFKKDNRLIVHVLNQSVRSNKGVVIPLHDYLLRFLEFSPRSGRLVYPRRERLKVEGDSIALPAIDIHAVVEIDI